MKTIRPLVIVMSLIVLFVFGNQGNVQAQKNSIERNNVETSMELATDAKVICRCLCAKGATQVDTLDFPPEAGMKCEDNNGGDCDGKDFTEGKLIKCRRVVVPKTDKKAIRTKETK